MLAIIIVIVLTMYSERITCIQESGHIIIQRMEQENQSSLEQ